MMKKWLMIFFLVFISCKSHTYQFGKDAITIHSENTRDEYIIQIKTPKNFNDSIAYTIVYASDGLIGTGKYILGVDSSWAPTIPGNCIIVTILHPGNSHHHSRRAFNPT